jgi:hypothetical protein
MRSTRARSGESPRSSVSPPGVLRVDGGEIAGAASLLSMSRLSVESTPPSHRARAAARRTTTSPRVISREARSTRGNAGAGRGVLVGRKPRRVWGGIPLGAGSVVRCGCETGPSTGGRVCSACECVPGAGPACRARAGVGRQPLRAKIEGLEFRFAILSAALFF